MSFLTKTSLYQHQQAAIDKLLSIRVGALFMDMGTGKTRTAIELVYRRQDKIDRVIWYCPVSLKTTIAREIEKHTTASLYVFDDETASGHLPTVDFYIIGTESMSGSNRVILAANEITTPDSFAIVDESTYIKTPYALRSDHITRISERTRYRAILTGTPITQGIVDLFGQLYFLSPKILGYNSFYSFAHNHLEYSDKFPGMIVRAHRQDYIAQKMLPYVYQVTKEECLDLPDKVYESRYFQMTTEQRYFYEQTKSEILDVALEQGEEIDTYAIFKLFTALQQISSGYLHSDGQIFEYDNHRLTVLQNAIDSILPDEKVIIWCKYVYSLKRIQAMLGNDCAVYYGDLNEKERDTELDTWRKSKRFLIATMQTGGHGLTLTDAAYAIFYENDFKYASRIQAEDRIHRIGQTRKPTYISIYCDNGIERRIEKAMQDKANVVAQFDREIDKVKDKKEAVKDL